MKRIIKELLLTFSEQKSLISSKRLERFSLFALSLSAVAYYLFKGIYNWEIGSSDLLIIIATLLGYAGFNTVIAKKNENTES
jgi:hypothetical protein